MVLAQALAEASAKVKDAADKAAGDAALAAAAAKARDLAGAAATEQAQAAEERRRFDRGGDECDQRADRSPAGGDQRGQCRGRGAEAGGDGDGGREDGGRQGDGGPVSGGRGGAGVHGIHRRGREMESSAGGQAGDAGKQMTRRAGGLSPRYGFRDGAFRRRAASTDILLRTPLARPQRRSRLRWSHRPPRFRRRRILFDHRATCRRGDRNGAWRLRPTTAGAGRLGA